MASLKDATKLADQLESLVGDLRSELDGEVDFENLVSIADRISETSDGLAETFSNINDALMQRLGQAAGGDGSNGASNGRSQRSQRKRSGAGSRS